MSEEPRIRFAEDGTPLPFTEQEVDVLVPLVAQHFAPRRFALCEVARDSDGQPFDVLVIAWGIQTGQEDDSVEVFGYPDAIGQTVRGSFSSAETAAHILSGREDVRLTWLDAVVG